MSTIDVIDLGAVPNDGNGDPARIAGQTINDNFANLNADKIEGITTNSSQITVDNSDPINPELQVPQIVESIVSGDGSLTVDNADPANLDIRLAGGGPGSFTQLEVPAPFPAAIPDAWHNRHVILNGGIGALNIDIPNNLLGGAGFICRITYVGNATVSLTPGVGTVIISDDSAINPPQFRDGGCSVYVEQRTGQPNQVFVRGDLA